MGGSLAARRASRRLAANRSAATIHRGRPLKPFRLATLVVALSLAYMADVSFAADAASAPAADAAAPLTTGLDRSGMDAGVRPQDSLFGAMNQGWLTKTDIPADKPEYGTFIQLRDLSDERVK